MIRFAQGNLLESPAEALVNTVNTVGVMGKGIALMFKERFAKNFRLYSEACKARQIQTGQVFVTENNELDGPKWIVNFPTKRHWRQPSKLDWITEGLCDLRRFIIENEVRSIAIPPLGSGNGGLEWEVVKQEITRTLSDLQNVEVVVYEPTAKYQNVSKRKGVEKLTPARALIAELVRRYWVLGMECSLLEIQKLAWFLEREVTAVVPSNPLDLRFKPNKFGPYADRLRHLLEGLDGSYLHCEKRLSDADPLDVIWFEEDKRQFLQTYLKTEAKAYLPALERTSLLIEGFESPFGMELLASVDWLLSEESIEPNVEAIRQALRQWPEGAGERKSRLFDDRAIGIALSRLTTPPSPSISLSDPARHQRKSG